ncbi:MAG TPA: N-acetylglucosamine kinase [Cytophagales bacterium]|nr:N-acetylglucosamine kinase [Cytophagales bacterium]HCR53953.1 N-acetylglucosamine kinase [Cytophagales bacterium]
MILIADSGGSKLDWRILHEDGKIDQASGPGFNPYYQPASDLENSIEEQLAPKVSGRVKKIFFYGAGLSSPQNHEIVCKVLQRYFDKAVIEVNLDLLGAARSLCGDEPGIACILGTGSNSCFYDGNEISRNVASLGWILGDEGSGAHMGKQLIKDYIRNEMPDQLSEQLKARFPLNREEILSKVYQQERPAAFLGSFSRFIFQHIKEPYCYQLVYSGFEDFYKRNVMQYEDHQHLKVHFTGSVAFYFSNVLRQVANDMGIVVKNIAETPIAGLALFHKKDLND